MSQTLGEKLRQAREERGISVSEVAEQTRIAPLYIESIENDDYKPLPGGIFNKGFVKSYAKYVGVDEQEALQDYANILAISSAEPEPPPRSYRPEVLTDDRAMATMMPTLLLAAVMLGVIVAGVLLLLNYIRGESDDPAVATNIANSAANVNSQQNGSPEPTSPNVPSFEAAEFVFSANNEPVWLSYTVDGRRSEAEVRPGSPLAIDPKESLILSYHRSRAAFAGLAINGKQITLPSSPSNINSSRIDVEVNRQNFVDVWQSGQFTGSATVGPASTGSPVPPRPPANRPRPGSNTSNSANANRPKPPPSRPAANSTPRSVND